MGAGLCSTNLTQGPREIHGTSALVLIPRTRKLRYPLVVQKSEKSPSWDGESIPLFTGFFVHLRWLFGISSLSTVAPENQWLEDETSLWNDLKWSLSGEHVKLSFREGIHPEVFAYGSPENKPGGVSGNSFWFNYYYFVVQNGVISGGCSPQPQKSARWAP